MKSLNQKFVTLVGCDGGNCDLTLNSRVVLRWPSESMVDGLEFDELSVTVWIVVLDEATEKVWDMTSK